MFKKFNWGHGIALFFLIFIGSIFYRVWLSSQHEVNLVVSDYYPKGIVYQQEIDKQTRTNTFIHLIQANYSADSVSLYIPVEYVNKLDSGEIQFYRPSDFKDDLFFEMNMDSTGNQYFSAADLKRGKYIVKFNWTNNGVSYFAEKELFIEK